MRKPISRRLPVVQSRVARARVVLVEVVDRDAGRAADALGHVLAGHLEVNAAERRAAPVVDVEGELDLAQDVVEVARLQARWSDLGVAVHRVADPEHRCARRA